MEIFGGSWKHLELKTTIGGNLSSNPYIPYSPVRPHFCAYSCGLDCGLGENKSLRMSIVCSTGVDPILLNAGSSPVKTSQHLGSLSEKQAIYSLKGSANGVLRSMRFLLDLE